MTTNPLSNLPGPGLPAQTYLHLLANGNDTGWYDKHGRPAPWPDDFLDPDSRWQPAAGGDDTTHPGTTPF